MNQINYIPDSVLSAATIESGYSLENLKTGMATYYRTSAISASQWMKADIGGYNDFLNLYWPLEENILAPVGSGTPNFPVSNAGAYFTGTSGGYMSQITASAMRFEEVSNVYWGLIEGSATNLCLRSEEFDNVVWTKVRTIGFSNVDIAPNGVISADKITAVSAGGTIFETIAVTSATEYTLSFYAKNIDLTTANVGVWNATGGAWIFFNSYLASLSTTEYTRIERPFTTPAGCVSIYLQPIVSMDINTSIYIWGAQLEEGVLTSYIPTAGAVGTRFTESGYPTIPIAGNFNQAAGTAFIEWLPHFSNTNLALLETVGIISVKNAGTTTLLYIFKDGGGGITLRSSDQANSAYVNFTFTANKHYLLAVRWWSTAGNKPSDDANTTGIQVGYSDDNGLTWTWGDRTDYDGEYQVLGTDLIVHFNTEWPYHIRNIRLYGKAFTTIEVEDGVENLDGSELVNDFGLFNHNLSSTAIITLQADQEDYKNTWNSPLYSTTLPWTNKRIIDESLIQTYRFWKTSFLDASNVDGYIEGAFWFLGQNLTDTTSGVAFTVIDPNDRFGDIRLSWSTTDY